MRYLFLVGALLWGVFTFLSLTYGEEDLSMRNYIEAKELMDYALISWLITLVSLILSIIGLVKIKKKGVRFLGVLSLLTTLFTAFWIGVMISSAGTDLDEIYYGLIGIGLAQVFFFLIFFGRYPKKPKQNQA